MSTTAYTLTSEEASQYDSADRRISDELMRSLRARFGEQSPMRGWDATEVHHPDDFVIGVYYREPVDANR